MARKRTETATEPSKTPKARVKFTTANKCMKTTTKKLHEFGKHNGGREKSSSKCSAESLSSQDQRLINTEDRVQEVPVLNVHSGKAVRPSEKMKLQLFPLDAHTREGLEKDGFHPYLELTLSSRKKISSVLQRIQSKWGSSEISRGDPTLYPYDKSVLATGRKWIADSNITTSDVYVAIGAPSVFRLRYGWSSETDNKSSEPPSLSLSTPDQVTDPPPLENIPPSPNRQQVVSVENTMNNGSGQTLFQWDDGLTSLSIGGLLSEVSLKENLGNNCQNLNVGNAKPTLWVDNLANISIGGLFSEASLQDRPGITREQDSTHNYNNSNDQPSVSIGSLLYEASSLGGERRFRDCNKTWETRRAITEQALPIISDSLDAFLASKTDHPRATCPRDEPSHSSILDAEDTCHAFSYGKAATTSQKIHEQVSGEGEKKQERDKSKPAKPLFGSMVFNQDSSLGFSGIKWDDSRGPFDFGLSSSRKFCNGDSVSSGAVVKDLPLEDVLQKH